MNVFASMWGKFARMYVCECVLMLLSTKTIVPCWTDKLSIVSTLHQCKYNVDDTVSTYLTVKDEGEVMLLEVLPHVHTPPIHFSISFDLTYCCSPSTSFMFSPFLTLPDGLDCFTQSSSPSQNIYLEQLKRELTKSVRSCWVLVPPMNT